MSEWWVEMTADHDDFVLESRIGAGDLGDGVVAVLVIAGELRLDVGPRGFL
jgi:hypothetical protein